MYDCEMESDFESILRSNKGLKLERLESETWMNLEQFSVLSIEFSNITAGSRCF